jgi:hypothetical protein
MAQVQARVRQRQRGRVDAAFADQQQVQVQRARRVAVGALAAVLRLDGLQRPQQGLGLERRCAARPRR